MGDRRKLIIGVLALFGDAIGVAAGQQPQKPVIPADMVPPPGMCRIWIRNAPARQQPAPTDCASAARNKPANADLVYGDDYAKGRSAARGPTTPAASRSSAGARVATPPTAVPPPPPQVPVKPGGRGGG